MSALWPGIARLALGLGATTNLSDAYSWGIWIGFDFGLIALAGVGFTMAAVAHILRRHQYHAAVRPAILAGLVGYVAVLLLLVLDLGRPDRFYNFILFWNPHSPLFEISWCVLLYTTVLVIETSPFIVEKLRWKRIEKLPRLLERIMLPVAIVGVTLSSLHQSTLGTLYLNMPYRLHALWYTPLLPLMFLVSSIMAGLSLAAVAYWLAGRLARQPVQPKIIFGLARAAAIISLIYLALKLGEVVVAGEIGLALSASSFAALWWIELLLCVALPALLILWPRRQEPATHRRRPAADPAGRADEPLRRHHVRAATAPRHQLLPAPDRMADHSRHPGRRRAGLDTGRASAQHLRRRRRTSPRQRRIEKRSLAHDLSA